MGLTYNPDRHLGLITSTWLHSYRQSAWAKLMHPATYTQAQRGVIDGLLSKEWPDGQGRGLVPDVLLASEGTVIAWSLWEHDPTPIGRHRRILHYIWVAQPIRRSGFASRILREHGADRSTVMSHWSHSAQAALDGSASLRQLFCVANSPHVRFCPTLATNPDAFVAM